MHRNELHLLRLILFYALSPLFFSVLLISPLRVSCYSLLFQTLCQSPEPYRSILSLPRIFMTHQGQILCCSMHPHPSSFQTNPSSHLLHQPALLTSLQSTSLNHIFHFVLQKIEYANIIKYNLPLRKCI